MEELKKTTLFDDHVYELASFEGEIFLFHKGTAHYFNRPESFDNIDQFLQKILHPDVMELDASFDAIYQNDPAQFFLLFSKSFQDPIVKEFERFAKDHKKQINFVIATEDTVY